MTPLHAPGAVAPTYVVCLDCGKQFEYDWKQMRIGRSVKPVGEDSVSRFTAA